ncbi:MAG: S-layer homology domain-containing protein [Symploca sp. SIO3E6]|nr:S-layer homology domain-containing protein [Caldora sp. SIO3E6]
MSRYYRYAEASYNPTYGFSLAKAAKNLMKLIDITENNLVITIEQLKLDHELVLDIQIKLHALGLYPRGRLLDGQYGSGTAKGLNKFCQLMELDDSETKQIDATLASALLNTDPTEFRLKSARNKEELFQEFLAVQPHPQTGGGVYLDSSINQSPFQTEIDFYSQRLKEKPDGIEVVSLEDSRLASYPTLGQKPQIETEGLDFLHSDIKQACVCLGSSVNGQMQARWFGRNALDNVEFWSDTKIIPTINLVCQLNSSFPFIDIDQCLISGVGSSGSYSFYRLVVALSSYNFNPASSNQIAAMFKRFSTYAGLEQWLKEITGNQQLTFRGLYGENPLINFPELVEASTGRVLLSAAPLTATDDNSVSAYDLTRIMSMLGWHYYLNQNSRLPGAQWDSLESVIRGTGTDIARYVDAAIERLGLQRVIKSPVIISKAGWGRSLIRDRFEITYTALVQFIDRRPKVSGKPSKLRTLVITLLGAKDKNNAIREEQELDARIATEVTEIIRRVVTEELGGNPGSGNDTPAMFTDITEDIYRPQIEEAVTLGFISGFKEDNTFRPLNPLTREQMVAMLLEALTTIPNLSVNIPAQTTTNPYPDVEASRWSASKIAWAKNNQLIAGYPNGQFRPSNPVTRAELMAVLKKIAEYALQILDGRTILEPTQKPFPFSDISGHWAQSIIREMSSFGGVASPLNEMGDGFYPRYPALRNYSAAATLRMVNTVRFYVEQ